MSFLALLINAPGADYIAIRVLRDDPSKSDMHNRQGLSLRQILEAVGDWRLWPLYILGLTHQSGYILSVRHLKKTMLSHFLVPTGPPQTYLTLSLRNLGFSTTETNLLSIPSTVIGLVNMMGAAYFSEIVDSRVLATVYLQFWALPLLIALYTFTRSTSQWVYFAVVSTYYGFLMERCSFSPWLLDHPYHGLPLRAPNSSRMDISKFQQCKNKNSLSLLL